MIYTKEILRKVWDDQKFINMFSSLAFRWLDEHEYEDINDYKDVLVKYLNKFFGTEDFVAIKMTKRPFGFKFSCDYKYNNGNVLKSVVTFKCTANGEMSFKVEPQK